MRLPPALIQAMVAEGVATAVCRVALGSPVNGTIESSVRNSFAWLNSSGGTWPRFTISAK